MTASTTGACLCGTVRFRIAGTFDGFFLCHCSRCRKDTGSAHAANLVSATATLSWLSGPDAVKTYRLPGTRHERSFCAICGSALPSVQAEAGLLVVPAGSLDTPVARRPDAHICFASRAAWEDDLAQLARIDGLPDGLPDPVRRRNRSPSSAARSTPENR